VQSHYINFGQRIRKKPTFTAPYIKQITFDSTPNVMFVLSPYFGQIRRWAAIKMGLEDIRAIYYWIGLAREFGLNCPCICIVILEYVSVKLRDRIVRVRFIPKIESLRTINMYLGLLRKQDDHVRNKHNLGASPPLVSRVSFG
jgi:hypothetical protein